MARDEAAHPARARRGAARPVPRHVRLRRPPRVARRQRLLPVAVRGGGDPDPRRRRRVVDRDASASGADNRIELTHELRFPHSLGLLYSAFTYYTGFKVNSGEYKVMGLAPYGEPRYARSHPRAPDRPQRRRVVPHEHALLQLLPGPDDDLGEVRRAVRRAAARSGRAAHPARDGPRGVDPGGDRRDHAALRPPRPPARRACANLAIWPAASASTASATGSSSARGRSTTSGCSRPPGDAGGALGVALLVWHQLLDRPRAVAAARRAAGLAARPGLLRRRDPGASSTAWACRTSASTDTAELCDDGRGLPRARRGRRLVPGTHGVRPARARLSLASWAIRAIPTMQSRINLKIKFREGFRPFAPAVLGRARADYFALDRPQPLHDVRRSPWPTRSSDRCPPTSARCSGLDRLQGARARACRP